jgi:pseudouridine synthase
MVKSGRISINGVCARDAAAHIDPTRDLVTCDGQKQDMKTDYHLMLYKPEGLLTAARDKKQPTVFDLLPPLYRAAECMPIGRLDKDTTGLLLFTTDGQLNHLLLSPKRHVDKTYLAVLRDELKSSDIAAFEQGLELSDFTALPAKLEMLAPKQARITVHEGKFHQIKRMFEAIDNKVEILHREAFGGITLDTTLKKGEWRELTEKELNLLREKAATKHE